MAYSILYQALAAKSEETSWRVAASGVLGSTSYVYVAMLLCEEKETRKFVEEDPFCALY